MAKFVFSAFADEITSDFNGQLEALERLGIPLLECAAWTVRTSRCLTTGR